MEEYLNKNQLALLSKTLEIDDPSKTTPISTEFHTNNITNPGIFFESEQLKLSPSFSASFFSQSTHPHSHQLYKIFSLHDVFSGIYPSNANWSRILHLKQTEEEEEEEEDGKIKIWLRGEKVRERVWNKQAIRIQAAWRGMKERQRVLNYFKNKYRIQALQAKVNQQQP